MDLHPGKAYPEPAKLAKVYTGLRFWEGFVDIWQPVQTSHQSNREQLGELAPSVVSVPSTP